MLTTAYLYDCSPSEFKRMPYEDALKYKNEQASILVGKLLVEPFMTRDSYRLSDIYLAITFNEKLLKEMK